VSIATEKLASLQSLVLGIVDGLVNDPSWQNGQILPVSEGQYRKLYHQGRINDTDLSAAFDGLTNMQTKQPVCSVGERIITRGDIYRIALVFDMATINDAQLAWWRDEMSAFSKILPDVPDPVRQKLLADAYEADAVKNLWKVLVDILDLPDVTSESNAPSLLGSNMAQECMGFACNPLQSESLDLVREQSNNWREGNNIHNTLRQIAGAELDSRLSMLGATSSLRDFLQSLSGVDVLEQINQQMQRTFKLQVDAEFSAWSTAAHQNFGLYGLWRTLARHDASLFLHQLTDWQDIIAELPEAAVSTIILQLQCFDIPSSHWQAYLRRLALESSCWMQHHPYSLEPTTALADLLAIRLTLDRLWLNQVCYDLWKIEAKTSSLKAYFHKYLSEFWVRLQLHQGNLPEYLTQQAEALIIRSGSERQCRKDWQQLADMTLLIQCHPSSQQSQQSQESQENNRCWRLFRLFQHLGCNAGYVQNLDKTGLHKLLSVLDDFNLIPRQEIWRHAAWHHDQSTLLASANHLQNPTGAKLEFQPKVGVVGCDENYTDTNAGLAHSVSHRFNQDNRFWNSFRDSLLLTYLWIFISAPLLLGNILIKTFLPELHRWLNSTSN